MPSTFSCHTGKRDSADCKKDLNSSRKQTKRLLFPNGPGITLNYFFLLKLVKKRFLTFKVEFNYWRAGFAQ